jgi:hypothetical protein
LTTTNPPALQLYTVRDQLPGHRKDVLARIAGFGYGAVEPFNILADPEGLRDDLAGAGLSVSSVHATPSGDEAEAGAGAAPPPGSPTPTACRPSRAS